MPLLPGGLISRNAVVTIESVTTSQDAEGGTSEAYSTLADDVPVLIGNVTAERTDRLGGAHNVVKGTLTGANSGMARADVRYLVKSASVYGLTGIYLFPESAAVHGAAGEGVMAAGAWYEVRFSTVRTT